MSPKEISEQAIAKYHSSGKAERDQLFRRNLQICGPQLRRWLGWGGTLVRVLRYFESHSVSCMTGTAYLYEFETLDGRRGTNGEPLISHEVNFCDDDDVLDLLPPWFKHEKERLLRELKESPIEYAI